LEEDLKAKPQVRLGSMKKELGEVTLQAGGEADQI
jgi:hypothetical protein